MLANDIISDLIFIHEGLVNDPDRMITETKALCAIATDKESYVRLRELHNEHPNPYSLWALMLSCTNNMLRFNKKFKFNQTYGKRSWNKNTDKKVEEFVNHISQYKDKMQFISRPFNKIMPASNSMVYLDPPYYGTEAGYNAYWSKEDEENLYTYLKEVDNRGASFMISGVYEHDDYCSELLSRLAQDGYRVEFLEYDYNKVSRKGKKDTKEVIIMNY